ncbi:MAG: zinc ribbon domain-containing protein [Promethearchaeia archaeon]
MMLKPRISGDITYKRKWEFFATVLGLGLGMVLYLITLLIPNYTTDIIYEALPIILRGFFTSINDTSIENPYYPIIIFFIAYIDFPSCLAWLIPGFLIGYFRNKQFINLEIKNNGWKVFWHGAYFIEIAFVLFAFGLGITFILQFIPGLGTNEIAISFFGSGIIKLMLFFISPFFWIGLFTAGIGGYLGTKFAVNKAAKSEVVIEEVEPEEIFEEEEIQTISKEIEGIKEEIWPEKAKAKVKIEDEDLEIPEVDVEKLKEKIKMAAETLSEASQVSVKEETVKCPKCGKILPKGAKFCNNCGTKLI